MYNTKVLNKEDIAVERAKMNIIIDRSVNGEAAVRAHPLFGSGAVFLECGLHDPDKFCFDHHIAGQSEYLLSVCGMVHQDLLKRRRFPEILVMNHIRHLDNLVAAYLLTFQGLAATETTAKLVAVAELMDRVGPLAVRSADQTLLAVLNTAQATIPFKEWELSDAERGGLLQKAIMSIRQMVTMPVEMVTVHLDHVSNDGKFVIGTSDQPVGVTLYDQGRDAYAVYAPINSGGYKWTLARASVYIPFYIPEAIAELNELEGCPASDMWGGRGEIGGSPKTSGSQLTIDAVIEVLKKHYRP